MLGFERGEVELVFVDVLVVVGIGVSEVEQRSGLRTHPPQPRSDRGNDRAEREAGDEQQPERGERAQDDARAHDTGERRDRATGERADHAAGLLDRLEPVRAGRPARGEVPQPGDRQHDEHRADSDPQAMTLVLVVAAAQLQRGGRAEAGQRDEEPAPAERGAEADVERVAERPGGGRVDAEGDEHTGDGRGDGGGVGRVGRELLVEGLAGPLEHRLARRATPRRGAAATLPLRLGGRAPLGGSGHRPATVTPATSASMDHFVHSPGRIRAQTRAPCGDRRSAGATEERYAAAGSSPPSAARQIFTLPSPRGR